MAGPTSGCKRLLKLLIFFPAQIRLFHFNDSF